MPEKLTKNKNGRIILERADPKHNKLHKILNQDLIRTRLEIITYLSSQLWYVLSKKLPVNENQQSNDKEEYKKTKYKMIWKWVIH